MKRYPPREVPIHAVEQRLHEQVKAEGFELKVVVICRAHGRNCRQSPGKQVCCGILVQAVTCTA